MRLLIIEDEVLAIEKLTDLIREVEPGVEIAGTTTSVRSSVLWLQQHEVPDLIMMDIELSDGQSFDIFNHIDIKCPVIFTTSYDEYAIRAFKVNSIDYLLKPVEKEDLQSAFDKYHRLHPGTIEMKSNGLDIGSLLKELRVQLTVPGYRNRFLVRQGQQYISVEVSEIAYFFAEGRLSFFMTWDKHKYVVEYTMEELEEMMDPQMFFRANRAYLIHTRSVRQIHNYFNGKLKLMLTPVSPKDDVIVSRERSASFKKWMGR